MDDLKQDNQDTKMVPAEALRAAGLAPELTDGRQPPGTFEYLADLIHGATSSNQG